MNKKHLKYFIFIIFELFLISIIVFLALKIKKLYESKVKGVQYATVMKKRDYTLDTENDGLKHFYEPKPNTYINESRKWFDSPPIYKINSDSLNERFEYATDKPANIFRIITLGDSFTFGIGVNTSDNWSERLEDYLNEKLPCENIKKYEVINLGVGGYDIEYSVERYRVRGSKYNPDLVIWLHDSFPRIYEKLISYTEEFQQIPDYEKIKYKTINEFYPDWEYSQQKIFEEFGKQEIINYQVNILKSFNKLYKGPLFFVIFPMENEYENAFKSLTTENDHIYLLKLKISYQNKSLFFPDYHPNKKGHDYIANELYDFLIKQNLVCR